VSREWSSRAGVERAVATQQRHRVTGRRFVAADRQLRPRVGEQPAEPHPDRDLLAHRRRRLIDRGQRLLRALQELRADGGEFDVSPACDTYGVRL